MHPVGFEPTISVLERANTVRALDRAATAIGNDDCEHSFLKHFQLRSLKRTHQFSTGAGGGDFFVALRAPALHLHIQ
jgi:hypothetical protein